MIKIKSMGFVKPWQPGRVDCQTTVQVGGVLLLVDVQGFQHTSSPTVPFHFSCLGGLQLVVVRPGVDCNSIVGVMRFH